MKVTTFFIALLLSPFLLLEAREDSTPLTEVRVCDTRGENCENLEVPEFTKFQIVGGFSQVQSIEKCKNKGKRLANILELAIFAQANGAKGIVRPIPEHRGLPSTDERVLAEVDQMYERNCKPIEVLNSEGEFIVIFYYCWGGFKSPWKLSRFPDIAYILSSSTLDPYPPDESSNGTRHYYFIDELFGTPQTNMSTIYLWPFQIVMCVEP